MRIKAIIFYLFCLVVIATTVNANDFSDNTYLVSKVTPSTFNANSLWDFLAENNWVALDLDISIHQDQAILGNSTTTFNEVLDKVAQLINTDESKIIPIFINFSGNIHILDSIISESGISNRIFYLPQGETWPSVDYLVQSNRRIIFFVEGNIQNESRILHPNDDYALQISADQITPNSALLSNESNINKELFKINSFDRLPIGSISSRLGKNMIPDYVNFLLESWLKYGKKPNFIGVGNDIVSFDFLVDQLNSFNAVKGQVKTTGKNMERVYWKNPDILISGGKFSFPIRGGEEMILSPFAPGYSMTPSQLIITGEMTMPDKYSIMASPLNLSAEITAGFEFDGTISDFVNPERQYTGVNYSFSEDIDRGTVLRLPENANILLGDPSLFGLPNSSFTVSCFVKFTDILEFGDNAILGNDEVGYRRGMHLILRSGHPYFGLWANDYMSEEILQNNTWYHLVWRYILETGQQAIFLNGNYVGGSDGHPPYSGTSDLHIGSAFSQGASLRGYMDNLHIWNRPLGNEEINRLSLDEAIQLEATEPNKAIASERTLLLFISVFAVLVALVIAWYIIRKKKAKVIFTESNIKLAPKTNQIQLFGEFKAVNSEGKNVSGMITPKVKELLLFTIIKNLKNNKLGSPISEIDATLWEGIPAKKVANNRAVTLNKLRKILLQFNQVEIISGNGYLQLKTGDSFFCDYEEAINLCQIQGGMNRQQLETFYHLVKAGSLLKGIDWPWLDEIRGYIGNQVIDNLLKLAAYYQKEKKYKDVENVAQRILDYDDLSEEAVYLQIWSQQKAGNSHMAKFHFKSFCTRYGKAMNEEFKMSFNEFTRNYADKV